MLLFAFREGWFNIQLSVPYFRKFELIHPYLLIWLILLSYLIFSYDIYFYDSAGLLDKFVEKNDIFDGLAFELTC